MKTAEAKNEEYYILDKGAKRLGPFTIKELKNKKLESTTPLLKKGQNNWQYAANVKSLNKKPFTQTLENIALFLFTAIVTLLILVFISRH